jgi:hypothetical protein
VTVANTAAKVCRCAAIFAALSLITLCGRLTPSAWAQGAGVRAGVSVDPDQFYFGGHLELGPVVEQLWFRPNLEIGIGNSATVVAINGEFSYPFPLRRREWSVYVGAGPAVNIISFDNPTGNRDTNVEGGFNFLLGLSHEEGFFTELKVGALDSPDLKFGIGYTFRR